MAQLGWSDDWGAPHGDALENGSEGQLPHAHGQARHSNGARGPASAPAPSPGPGPPGFRGFTAQLQAAATQALPPPRPAPALAPGPAPAWPEAAGV